MEAEPQSRATLMCQICCQVYQDSNLELVMAWYLIHTARTHWDYLVMLHDADDAQLAKSLDLLFGESGIK